MVDDIAARAPAEIDLVEPRGDAVRQPLEPAGRLERGAGPVGVAHHQQNHVADVMRRLDHQPAVHIGLARAQARIARNVEGGAAVGQADAHGFGRRVAITVLLAVMVGYHQLTLADQFRQHLIEQPHATDSML